METKQLIANLKKLHGKHLNTPITVGSLITALEGSFHQPIPAADTKAAGKKA